MKLKLLARHLVFTDKRLLRTLMRTFVFLFCTAMFGFTPSNGFSQNSNIQIDSDKTITLEEVFELIQTQTNYQFIYDVDMVKDAPDISVKRGVVKAQTLLERSLTPINCTYEFTKNVIIVKKMVLPLTTTKPKDNPQQKITVRGTVLDNYGIPLPGANVIIRSADESTFNKMGTATDFDGKYELSFEPIDDDRIFITASYIGYKPALKQLPSTDATIDFVLEEDAGALEEVVVTGYQTINRERATGAFNSVKREDIKNNATQTVGSLLQGIAPGIEIVETADGEIDLDNVVVRGVGSIDDDSSTAPLIVVDGFPIDGGFNTINPNDVESISILKDAAAASIWGARAGNGVIVVTTKRAKEGKLKIEFNTFVRMRSKIDLKQNLPIANSATALAYEQRLWQPGGLATLSDQLSSAPIPNTLAEIGNIGVGTAFPNYSLGSRVFYDLFNGQITQAEANTILSRLSSTNSFDDIREFLLTTPIQQQYNLALATRNENSSTRFSFIYNDNKGSFINDENDQFLLNLNHQYRIVNGITLDINGMYEEREFRDSGIDFNVIGDIAPYENIINADGTYAALRGYEDPDPLDDQDFVFYDAKFLQMFQSNVVNLPYSNITFNPLRDARGTENVQKNTNYRINAALTIDLFDGLQFKPSLQYENFRTRQTSFFGEETSQVIYSIINGTSRDSFDPVTGTLGAFNVPLGAQLTESNTEAASLTIRNLLTYNKTFNKHSISALAGYERLSTTETTVANARTYGFDRATNSFATPDVPDSGALIWNSLLQDSPTRILDGRDFTEDTPRFVSYFGNASYNYDGRYTLSGSVRSDGANFIVEDKSQRFNPMWSVGLSWNAKNEAFLQNVDWIDRLQLRATNGENGNLVGSVATSPTINLPSLPDNVTNLPVGTIASLGNPNLRWERVNTLNFGLDFGIFKGALYGSIDYYNKISKELIAGVSVPTTTGTRTSTFNVGEMENKGIELNLNSDIRFSENFRWNTNLVLSHNESDVTSLTIDFFSVDAVTAAQYVETRPYRPIFAYNYDPSQNLILSESGTTYQLTDRILEDGRDVLQFMGTSVAPTIAGWNNTINYKGVTLTARIVGKFGHKFRRPTFNYNSLVEGVYHQDLEQLLAGNAAALGLPELITVDDPNNFRYANYAANSTALVEDADHIRLRQIYLSYDLPGRLVSRLGITGARIYAQAENLGNLWVANDFDLDPEFIAGFARAPEKAITLGVNVEF